MGHDGVEGVALAVDVAEDGVENGDMRWRAEVSLSGVYWDQAKAELTFAVGAANVEKGCALWFAVGGRSTSGKGWLGAGTNEASFGTVDLAVYVLASLLS